MKLFIFSTLSPPLQNPTASTSLHFLCLTRFRLPLKINLWIMPYHNSIQYEGFWNLYIQKWGPKYFRRIAGDPWQHFRWRFSTMFPAVGAEMESLHPVTEGQLWRGLKFQTCTNILNKFCLTIFKNSGKFCLLFIRQRVLYKQRGVFYLEVSVFSKIL